MQKTDNIREKTIQMNTRIVYNFRIDDIEKKLEEATKKMFSRSGRWSVSEFGRPKNSLIGHLRDDKWLASRLQEFELKDIFLGTILNYVKTSPVFKAERDIYEQKIVRWQITYMINDGAGWLVPKEFNGDLIGFDKNCDIGFRKGILDTLEAIGMNRDAIEKGIEENVDLWRENLMLTAFRNTYEPTIGFINLKFKEPPPASEEHRKAWMKFRLYQYYQEHKASIDKYGVVTPEMEMKEEEVQNLKEYLAKMHEERMAYLEELKNKPTQSKLSKNIIGDKIRL